ncbi:MAG: DUF4149 domain-containing protein, partial [Campylobacterales bacterium]
MVMNKITLLYVMFIGILAGAVVALGAFTASVVFHPQKVGLVMDRFSSGLLMSEIFVRFNYLLGATGLAVLGYE